MNKDEMRRLSYITLDQIINEIDVRFSHQNTKLYAAVTALQPKHSKVLDVKIGFLLCLLDSVDRTSVEAEFDVVKTHALQN